MVRLALVIAFIFPSLAIAHGGRTNSSGCHNDNKGGSGYHCHQSSPSETTTPPSPTQAPDPIPTPITTATHYPVPSQNPAVLRNSSIQPLQSVYAIDRVNLSCIHTSSTFYSADLVLSTAGFAIRDLQQVEQCQAFNGNYSFLTNILTLFDIDTGAGNYRASLELNKTGKFTLIHAQKQGQINPNTSIYTRDDWGQYWSDKDGDCQDTRSEVLKTYNQYQQDDSCVLLTGLWIDPYTQFEFYNANDLDIDHLVPLAYAHAHGGAHWSPELKNKFYNDIENLLPVSASSNRSKGSKSPAEWMPDNISYHCQYVDSFLYIVDKYHLDLSGAERANITKQCHS